MVKTTKKNNDYRLKKGERTNRSRATRRKPPLTLRTHRNYGKMYRDALKEKNEAAIEELIREHELEEAKDMRELEIGQDPRFPVAAIPDDLTSEEMRRQIKAQEELVKRQIKAHEERVKRQKVNSPIRYDYDGVPVYKYIPYGIESPIPKSSPKIPSLPNSPEMLPPLPMETLMKFGLESPTGGKQRKSKRKTSKKRSKKRNTRRRRKN